MLFSVAPLAACRIGMAQQDSSIEREFTGRGMATIFGAPLSWIALFGALMGALSIVPMLFYPFGGGFASAGMIIFGPLSGVILGPWAGAVAGTIGGLIGMFISPGSYPLGLVDVVFSGTLLPLFWGLAHPRYRNIFVPLFILWIIIYALWPYHIPGESGGFGAVSEPAYFFSFLWGPVGLIFYFVAQKRLLALMQSDSFVTRLIGYILYMVAPCTAWLLPWIVVYFALLNFPPDVAQLNNIVAWWFYVLPIPVTAGIVSMLLVRAIEQSGLRRVSGSLLDQAE